VGYNPNEDTGAPGCNPGASVPGAALGHWILKIRYWIFLLAALGAALPDFIAGIGIVWDRHPRRSTLAFIASPVAGYKIRDILLENLEMRVFHCGSFRQKSYL
jgi:hypothetical protein